MAKNKNPGDAVASKENREDKIKSGKLIQIILNGKIDMVPSGDDAREIVGIRSLIPCMTFDGEKTGSELTFAFSREMAEKIEWGRSFATIRFYINEVAINPETVKEEFIQQFYGGVESKYYHRYSELTGYLWTEEGFEVGGHDLIKILLSNIGKYIHLEIELEKK